MGANAAKWVLLWTDASIWLMVALAVAYALWARRQPNQAANWRRVFQSPSAMASAVVLLVFLGITLLDSVHYRRALPASPGAVGAAGSVVNGAVAHESRTRSLLEGWLDELVQGREATYSMPLAYESFTKESGLGADGQVQRQAPRLKLGGAPLVSPAQQWGADVATRAATGAAIGAVLGGLICALGVAWLARSSGQPWMPTWRDLWRGDTALPWRSAGWTVLALAVLLGAGAALSGPYHLLGTDLTGNDVLLQSLKSIRTAFVIGTLATLATLPLAVGLGIVAGYFRGWVDELIQYLYTVLSSVPNVLLIAACVLMVQVFLDKNPELFETGAERADLKLFLLCAVLGLTGWAGLCRLLRGETLKLRELEYVQAAQAFGVGPWRIMLRHIFPNLAHLMLIVIVLEFSSLILYEAVLSYVGVGVDPSMNSFGGMINLARQEMSRDPVVWWSFASAFVFMVALVLAANLFADAVRDAFDPRSAVHRPRRLRPTKAATQ